MTTINLKDFYPWYTHDEYIEVSEEVAEELHTSRRREAAHAERVRYNKAFYSLDCDDGIEYSCNNRPFHFPKKKIEPKTAPCTKAKSKPQISLRLAFRPIENTAFLVVDKHR